MREWTEQEEQEMIELARQGDPKANYELSLWALRRAEEEPDESRWNRLAAKCLVKAAKAGYGPAQERMAQVLHQAQAKEQPAPSEPEEQPAPRQPVRLSEARAARRSQGPAPESTARRPEPPQEDGFDWDDGEQAPRARTAGRGKKARSLFSRQDEPPVQDSYDDEPADDDYYDDEDASAAAPRWGEKQWRRVELICIAVCAVLLVLIAVMIITGRHGSGSEPANPTVPVAGDANTTTNTGADAAPSPEPGQYPDDETLAAIQKADLEVYPAESDYVSVPTTATVKVDSQSLRLRTGPSTTYVPPICNMEDGTTVDVFAIKNNWSLVLYKDGEDGPVYGWCSSEYLIVTSGAADNSSVG